MKNHIPVVGGGEDSDALSIMLHYITLILDLMTPNKMGETITIQKVLGDIRTKLQADTTFTWRPTILKGKMDGRGGRGRGRMRKRKNLRVCLLSPWT